MNKFDGELLRMFNAERYVLLIDHRTHDNKLPRLRVVFKHGYTPLDQLKAWVHAVEVGMKMRQGSGRSEKDSDIIRMAYTRVQEHFSAFIERLRERGWDVSAGILVAGTPKVLVEWREVGVEPKKDI